MDFPPHNVIKGRGAAYNPGTRFDKIELQPDGDYLDEVGERPGIKTEFYRDTTKSIINFNDSPDIGFSASLNPYRGCEHGCIYCYARPMHEYLGLSAGLDFETKIFVKEDAPSLLEKELNKSSWDPQVVVVGAATDPYQPVESKLKITRRVLEVFLRFRNPVAVITKNAMVARDVDLFKELNDFRCASVNISITTLDARLARAMEPRTSSPVQRLQAMEKLTKAGIPVNVMVAPIIPALNDTEIARIIQAAADAGACSAHYVIVRLPYANKDLFVDWLSKHFPAKKDKVLNRIRAIRGGKLYDSDWHKRMRGEGIFAQQIDMLFHMAYKKYGLDKRPRPPLTTEHFRPAGGQQLTFF